MTYVQIDINRSRSVKELAAQIVTDLLELGMELEQLYLDLGDLEWRIELNAANMEQIETTAWQTLRAEAAKTGSPPKDPLTKRSNEKNNKAIVNEKLQTDPAWIVFNNSAMELREEQIQLSHKIQAITGRLSSLRAAAGLLGKAF